MGKAILTNVIGAIVILAVIYFQIPLIWVLIGAAIIVLFVLFNPLIPPIESVPNGFHEKTFDTREIVLNYVEGPNNGRPLLFIPGQAEFWQGYKLVLPFFAKRFHVYVVDVRGHGKSTRTPSHYSYNIIGEDLKLFLEKVVREPAIVSGLSSGAILSLWLAANAPGQVSVAISEDPPLFASMWPRIKQEKYMHYLFETMVEYLGKPDRDLLGFFMRQGIPKAGQKELMLLPKWIARFIVGLFDFNRKLRPSRKYDVPLAPFNGKLGFKFLSEYDVDFSRATIDGRLTEGFDPVATLRQIQCPVLLLHANWSRDENWGLLGAMDDTDAELIRQNVKKIQITKVNSTHDVHMSKPKIFINVVGDYLNSH